jgi:hypothetical protein
LALTFCAGVFSGETATFNIEQGGLHSPVLVQINRADELSPLNPAGKSV